MTTSSTISSDELTNSLTMFEIKPGVRFSVGTLRDLLPDAETLLFFAKVYDLDYKQLSVLMSTVLQSTLVSELFHGSHSTDLQGYLLDGYYDEDGGYHLPVVPAPRRGDVTLKPDVPKGEILPEVWKSLEIEVAKSIKDVAAKLESVVGLLPGKQGRLLFSSMQKMNKRRPTIGDHQAFVKHDPQKQNLLIFDVSGSMTQGTVQALVDDVVALSYTANAHLAVVSNDTTHWDPGTFSTDDVLAAATYGGTHYETLTELLDRDWGVVITVADYDSSWSAKEHLLKKAKGSIDQVLDISLVYKPTYLAECVGQLASEVRPLLIATGSTPSQSFSTRDW